MSDKAEMIVETIRRVFADEVALSKEGAPFNHHDYASGILCAIYEEAVKIYTGKGGQDGAV